MGNLEGARNAHTNYLRIYQGNLRDHLKKITKPDQQRTAELAVETKIVHAVLGVPMLNPGTPENLLALEILKPESDQILLSVDLTGSLPPYIKADVERNMIHIAGSLLALRQTEERIPTRFNAESLEGHLNLFRGKVWPEYTTVEHVEKYGYRALDLVKAEAEWEIAFTFDPEFMYLRRSVVFEQVVMPFIKVPSPSKADYSNLGLSIPKTAALGRIARDLADRTLHWQEKAAKKEQPTPPLPQRHLSDDLSMHPGFVRYEAEAANLVWGIDHTHHGLGLIEGGMGDHPADEDYVEN